MNPFGTSTPASSVELTIASGTTAQLANFAPILLLIIAIPLAFGVISLIIGLLTKGGAPAFGEADMDHDVT